MLPFPIPHIQAAHFTPASRKAVDLVVLHSMESQEKPGTARNVAKWFAGPTAPRTSAHYCIDDAEVIQCVRDEDVAWAAPGANATGVHIEHAGRASQSEIDWRDEFSMAVLHLSVELCALLCMRWDIPARVIDVPALLGRNRGITTHDAVSRAFRKSSHTDPGESFPLAWYCDRVRALVAEYRP